MIIGVVSFVIKHDQLLFVILQFHNIFATVKTIRNSTPDQFIYALLEEQKLLLTFFVGGSADIDTCLHLSIRPANCGMLLMMLNGKKKAENVPIVLLGLLHRNLPGKSGL